MKSRFIALSLLSLSVLIHQGCRPIVGVEYQGPEGAAPDAWTASLAGHLKGGSSDIDRWWAAFKDPALNQLIDRVREANPNLRAAAQRISEARALRQVAQSQLLPTVGLTGQADKTRSSDSLLVPLPDNTTNFYSAGFDAIWEIDVFGGLRRSVEAADANTAAVTESYRDLLVILYAETALNYVEYRTLQQRIRYAQANIAAQEKTVEITEGRLEAELVPKIDVTAATTNLEVSRGLIPVLRTQLAFAKNRLATLTGGFPGSVERLLAKDRGIPSPKKGFSAGLPADLLRSRPDIRRAERRLASQTALIGVAEADLYPRFTLFGTFSLQSVRASDFFESQSRAYAFGPAFRWQIFTAGRIRSNIQIQEARTEQALANYERAVLLGVEEVETSMAAIANGWDLVATLDRGVASAQETVDLVKDNYTEGLIDFQRVLDAERVKFTTQDSAAVARGGIAKSYIALYKALGGGSKVDDVVPISEPQTKANTPLARMFSNHREAEVESEPEPEAGDDATGGDS